MATIYTTDGQVIRDQLQGCRSPGGLPGEALDAAWRLIDGAYSAMVLHDDDGWWLIGQGWSLRQIPRPTWAK